MTAGIQADGFDDLQRAMAEARGNLPKAMTAFLAEAARMTKGDAAGLVPRGPSGDARASLRVTTGPGVASVVGGGSRAPYYGWLEFGGRTGVDLSVERRFIRGGRYLWPAFDANRKRLLSLLDDDVADALRSAGLETT